MSAALLELDTRADHEVAQRARHEHVVRPCQCAYTCPDVYGDTADVVAADLALPGVQFGAHLDAEPIGECLKFAGVVGAVVLARVGEDGEVDVAFGGRRARRVRRDGVLSTAGSEIDRGLPDALKVVLGLWIGV